MVKLSWLFVIMLVIVGCIATPIVDRTILDSSKVDCVHLNNIDSIEINEIFSPGRSTVVGNYLVILNNSTSENLVFLYNKNTMEYLGRFINYGRANNEVLSPSYLYTISDSTFALNSSFMYECKYVIKNDVVYFLDKKQVVNDIPPQLHRISDSVYLMLNNYLDNKNTAENILVTLNSVTEELNERGVGVFPEYSTNGREPHDASTLFAKGVCSVNDYVFAFYAFAPIMRIYDNNLNLIEEVVLKGYENYDVGLSFPERLFFNYSNCFQNKIMVVLKEQSYDKKSKSYIAEKQNELYLFDDMGCLIGRFTLDEHIMKHLDGGYCFDDNYIYILNEEGDSIIIYKVRYNIK